MKRFASLITQLGQTTKSNEKAAMLAHFFSQADSADKLWAIALLSQRRPRRMATTTLLRLWAAELAGIPQWLFEESYHVVGDMAEAIALILPPSHASGDKPLTYWIDYIRALDGLEEADKREKVIAAWQSMAYPERFVFNKLITGGFRVGVSQKLMVRGLAQYTGIDENILAHRLMGQWTPDDTSFEQLILTKDALEDVSKPYPFYLAHPLEESPETLGAPDEWLAERKWDGIRGQLIIRKGEAFVWSRGEELVTDQFPEYRPLAAMLPNGTVIDGEILPYKDRHPLSFNALQSRIGRKSISKSMLREVPVILMAYDLLEWQGSDIRHLPFASRRRLLEEALSAYPTDGILLLSELVPFDDWEQLALERENARQHHSEGLMIKRKASPYQTGRKKGDWWKWKAGAISIDAVLIYAQRGQGPSAHQYTDFTFAVWDGEVLTPFTKAYSGLADSEYQEITNWVNRNTVERFGPVRSVRPAHVFEIAFDGIRSSSRHKSGVALRSPRINRWRKDKPIREANTLEDLHGLLKTYGN